MAGSGHLCLAVEAKSGATVADDSFDGLRASGELAKVVWPGRSLNPRVVYGGTEPQKCAYATVVPWARLDRSLGASAP